MTRDIHIRNCVKKKAYDTRSQAEGHAIATHDGKPYRMRAYQCPVCGLYHLTKDGGRWM